MRATACKLCGAGLDATPLYSADGDVVCNDCYQRSVAHDRLETQAKYTASAAVAAACISFVVNPALIVSISAISGALVARRLLAQIEATQLTNRARLITLRGSMQAGLALGIVSTGLGLFALIRPFVFEEQRSHAVDAEPTRAELTAACDAHERDACAALGQSFSAEANYAAARGPLHVACTLRDWDACLLLGSHFDNGYHGPGQAQKAAEYYERSCKLHNSEGCRRAQRIKRERAEAEELQP